ncbi:MAG: hypothetical protein H0W02_04670 [Ktedonobacteraceae bacterium]|nr:hypothetical protein [Ktedonobacteraceae bacterium]
MEDIRGGPLFRQAWIAGIKNYFPGTPKPGYVAPWEAMAPWEQQAAIAVYEQIQQFVLTTAGRTMRLSREQKGRFVALCWIGQIYKHFEQPKESYVSDWEHVPSWQQETDADIFEAIEASLQRELRISIREIRDV